MSCWGRDYYLADNILPTQIKSQGQDIFASKPTINLNVSGRDIFNSGRFKPEFTARNPNRAEFKIIYSDSGYRVEAAAFLEYDGFFRVDVLVVPQRSIEINQLRLDFPFLKNVGLFYSRFIKYDYEDQRLDREDFLKSFGRLNTPVHMKFNPTVWIGNHDVGLEWICETDAGWSTVDSNRAIQLLPNKNFVLMQINVISNPLIIKKPYRFSFALYPTPVKKLPALWRNISLMHSWSKPDALSSTTHKLYGIGWPGKFPLKFQGLPIIEADGAGEKNRDERGPTPLEKIRTGRSRMQSLGIRFIPYASLYGMPSIFPRGERKDYYSAWSTMSLPASTAFGPMKGPRRKKRLKADYICLFPKSFRDFLVWEHVQALEKYNVDGLYLDLASPNFLCQNSNHPHGAHVKRGGVYYPFFWQRKLMQRLYIAAKSRKKDFLIAQHHAKIPIVCSGFSDLVLSGEALNLFFMKKPRNKKIANLDPSAYIPDYSQIPDDLYEIQYSQRKGFISMLLPEIIKWNKKLMNRNPDLLRKYTQMLLARTVVYDIPIYAGRLDKNYYNKVLQAQQRFGWLGDAEYIGPWESPKYIRSGGKNLKIAFYLKPKDNKILIVMANLTSRPIRENISLNLEVLKVNGINLSGNYRALDTITNFTYTIEKNSISATLASNEFRILVLY
jgi:hypothetical protein